MNTNNNNLQNLLGTAATTGDVDPAAATIALNIAKGNPKISNLGVSVDDIADSEAVAIKVLLDDSSSIEDYGNTQNVKEGFDILIDGYMGAKKKSNILISIDCLNNNGNISIPFTFLTDSNGNKAIPNLNQHNYNPIGGTPLYTRTAEAATELLAKIQEIRMSGLQERVSLIIISDGEDTSWSSSISANDVKVLITEILKTETNSVYAMGIKCTNTDFIQIFTSMGIPKDNIFEADVMQKDPEEAKKMIRRKFQTMSQSASASASATAAGGFGS